MAPFCASLTPPLPSPSLRALSFFCGALLFVPLAAAAKPFCLLFSPPLPLSSPLLQTKTFSEVLLYHSEIPNPTWLAGPNSPNLSTILLRRYVPGSDKQRF